MSKNKANKRVNKHSILEAQRAQQAVGRDNYVALNESSALGDAASVENVHVKNGNFSLAIPNIKKDLAKDFIFAVLSVALLVYLKESRLGFLQLSALFSR